MNSENSHDNTHKEMIKKFNFVSKDRQESHEILIAELLVGELNFNVKIDEDLYELVRFRRILFLHMASS